MLVYHMYVVADNVAGVTVFQGKELCSGVNFADRIKQLPLQMCWAVIMISGGHFAAAVFDG